MWETMNLATDADSSTDTKKHPASKAKCARRLYTLYEQKFSNLRHLLSNTFPQGFRKSKKFGHWTFRSGGKKRFKRSEQMNKSVNKLFSPQQFYTLYEPKF